MHRWRRPDCRNSETARGRRRPHRSGRRHRRQVLGLGDGFQWRDEHASSIGIGQHHRQDWRRGLTQTNRSIFRMPFPPNFSRDPQLPKPILIQSLSRTRLRKIFQHPARETWLRSTGCVLDRRASARSHGFIDESLVTTQTRQSCAAKISP